MAALFLTACSSDDNSTTPQPPENNAPTVTFTFSKLAVTRSSDVTLTVDTDDVDGDVVAVTWAVTRGVLRAADQGQPTMLWSTPGAVGRDTLTITADDGNGGTDTIQAVLDVGTPWTGNLVNGDQVWSASGSPYIIRPTGDMLSITDGSSLTINAGVCVYVDKDALTINADGGTLAVAGTPSDLVTIKSSSRSPQAGAWEGILGTGASPLIDLDYAVITHAKNAVKGVGSTNTRITGCTIMICSEAAILHESTGELIVEGSSITDNLKSGIRVKLFTSVPDSVIVRDNVISVNGRFADSVIYPNGEAAISLEFNDPIASVPVEITGNEISRNDFPGVRLITAVFPTITNNQLLGNEFRKATGKIDIELLSPFPAGEIDGTNNYWGFAYTDSTLIKDRIIDGLDSFNDEIFATVTVTPWLTAAP